MAANQFAGFDGSKTLSIKWSSRLHSSALKNSISKASRRVLSRTGSYTRRVMKNSIKTRKGSSSPGSPPHSHSGLLKRFILYDVVSDHSVVIGAALLPGMRKQSVSVPELLEQGGVVSRLVGKRGRQRATYQPRPFAKPALAIATERLAQLLQE